MVKYMNHILSGSIPTENDVVGIEHSAESQDKDISHTFI